MKKILAMLLVLSMVFALAACGAKEEAPAAPVEETPVEYSHNPTLPLGHIAFYTYLYS